MDATIDDLEYLLQHHGSDAAALYDAVAPRYERFRQLWLDLAGRDTEDRMLSDLAAVLAPGQRVLDAGCGTGAIAKQIRGMQPDAHLTLLDGSAAMLAQAGELGDERLVGDVCALPFDDDRFDVISCAWVIETVDDPRLAVTELLRVLAPDGFLLYTFCSMPGGWLSRAASVVLRRVVSEQFAGNFLAPEEIPWHDCDRSRKVSFHGGLSTYVLLRKCCTVSDEVLPPVSMDDVPPTWR